MGAETQRRSQTTAMKMGPLQRYFSHTEYTNTIKRGLLILNVFTMVFTSDHLNMKLFERK